MREDAAVSLIEDRGLSARVVERDGEGLPATMDYRQDRVNLVIADGRVSSASRG